MRVNYDVYGGIPLNNPVVYEYYKPKNAGKRLLDSGLDGLSVLPLIPAAGPARALSAPVLAARVPNPIGVFSNFLRRGERGQDLFGATVSEFRLFHSEAEIVNSPGYNSVRCLSDSELLDAARRPADGRHIKVSSETGQLMDGNTRIYELQRRGMGGEEVPFETYTPPNNSQFFFDQ